MLLLLCGGLLNSSGTREKDPNVSLPRMSMHAFVGSLMEMAIISLWSAVQIDSDLYIYIYILDASDWSFPRLVRIKKHMPISRFKCGSISAPCSDLLDTICIQIIWFDGHAAYCITSQGHGFLDDFARSSQFPHFLPRSLAKVSRRRWSWGRTGGGGGAKDRSIERCYVCTWWVPTLCMYLMSAWSRYSSRLLLPKKLCSTAWEHSISHQVHHRSKTCRRGRGGAGDGRAFDAM